MPKSLKKILHINQHVIKANAKNSETSPVITVKTYNQNRYAHEAVIYGQDGKPAARLIYSPEKPLSCGAKVWIESFNRVDVIVDNKTETIN